MKRFILFFVVMILHSPQSWSAQYGVLVGSLLPGGPDGVHEIIGIGGLRLGVGNYEFGFLSGAESRTVWHDLFANFRHNIQLHNIDLYGVMPHVGLGLDLIKYRTYREYYDDEADRPVLDDDGNQVYREEKRTKLGLHILSGVELEAGGPVIFRADMKLNLTPALILTIMAGLEFRFDEGKSEGPEQTVNQ